MTTKKIKTSDILGDNYYIYELTSSNYTPALNGTITITCTMKDVYGAAAGSKSITLYQNGTSKGAKTTNSSGVATWSIICSVAGIQSFKVGNKAIEVFVDNKSDTGHTHTTTDITNLSIPSASNTTPSADTTNGSVGTGTTWARSNHTHPKSSLYAESSHTHGNLQNNGQVGSTAQANKNVVTNSSGLITTEDKPTIPSKTSQLTNDSGFLTSHQSLDSKTVTVEKLATAESGYLSSYVVKQNGTQVGNTINIPKDFLVKSGSVKTVITDNHPVSGYSAGDRYIDFVINTKDNSGTDEHMYILVSDLVQDNGIEYINGTHSDTSTFIFTGNSYVFNSVSDIKDGSMIIYRVPVTSTNDSNDLKLQITCKGASGYGNGGSTAYIMKNNAHVTASQYPINTKLLLMYQNGWNIIGQTNLDDAYATANHTHNQYLTSHQDISGKIDTAGTGLSKSGTTLNHSNSITALTTASFKKVKYDSQGHITGTSDVSASDLPTHTHSQYLTAHQDISGKIDTAGTGLSKSGTTLNHSNSITALTTASFKKIKYDAQGHITGTADVTASDLPSHTHSAYVNPTIADNLTTNNSAQVLSAKQGKVLNDTKADKTSIVDWDNIVFVNKTDDSTGAIILNFLA